MKKLLIPFITFWGKKIEKKHFHHEAIYIGGCGRSGTTLLLSILSSHKDIFACPKELNLFENSKFINNKIYLPKFYRLYRTFITHKIEKSANRYCEKSPVNIHKIDIIDKLHSGKFKFIHIIRDGRDTILSKHPKRKSEYWVSPERWIYDISAGLKYMHHPNVLTIKYEELILNYELTINKICTFLEIDLSDEIQNWHQHTMVRKNNALFSPIDTLYNSSIGKWKDEKNIERAKTLYNNEEGRKLLQQLDYL